MLQLGLRLGLGTGNGYFIPYLKVTNTFVLPSLLPLYITQEFNYLGYTLHLLSTLLLYLIMPQKIIK